jgi:hypothetical protein
MAEEILLGTRVGAGVLPALTAANATGAGAGAAVASVGASLTGTAGNVIPIGRALSGPAFRVLVSGTAAAASYLLMSVHTQAFAMGKTPMAKNASGTPQIPDGAELIAESASGLCIARRPDAPHTRCRRRACPVNLHDIIDLPAAPLDLKQPVKLPGPRVPRLVRYLGTMSVLVK